MDNTNTVTISIDEYFDLRQKAEMNGFLMKEIGVIQERFTAIEERLWKLETRG